MTPAELAALHQAAFQPERGWRDVEFADLLASALVRLHYRPHGFALSRTVARESELLTLAVAPAHQRQGLGRALLADWLADCAPHADAAFLEVAADNRAALSLYHAAGFSQTGLRTAYYARKNAPSVDAILMRRDLTFGQPRE